MPLDSKFLENIGLSEESLIKLLHKEIQDVFTTTVCIEDVFPLPIQIDVKTQFNDCISAMVGFAGTYNGIVSLHMTEKLALAFTSTMLEMDVAEINADVHDALGEIANIIAGCTKLHIDKGGSGIRLSTPSVISGQEYFFSVISKADALTLLFDINNEWFIVSIVLDTE